MKHCAIYTRVSTLSQTTDNQLIELHKVAELKGYVVTQIFTDEGISGAKGRDVRTGFDNIIKGAIKKSFLNTKCHNVLDFS
jgi:DNA invertase Pin-like site-specific DNA recombinase